MPKFLEKVLERSAEKKGYSGDRADAYVFGTMNNLGAMHGNKETAKGRAMEKKHAKHRGMRHVAEQANGK